jgi:hypothetical protein
MNNKINRKNFFQRAFAGVATMIGVSKLNAGIEAVEKPEKLLFAPMYGNNEKFFTVEDTVKGVRSGKIYLYRPMDAKVEVIYEEKQPRKTNFNI